MDVAVAATAQSWAASSRAASLQRRPHLVAAMLAAAVTAAYAVCVWRHLGGITLGNRVDCLIQPVVALTAMVACFQAAHRSYPSYGRAWTTSLRNSWTLLGLAAGAWGAGALVWCWYLLVVGSQPTFPSLADAGMLAAIPLQVGAVVAFPIATVSTQARLRVVLDAVLIATCLLGLSWATVLEHMYHQESGPIGQQVVSLGYPLLAIFPVTMAFTKLAQSRRGSSQAHLALLSLALFALAVASSGFADVTLLGHHVGADLIHTGWLAGFLLIGLTATWPAPRPPSPPVDDDRAGLAAAALPYAALTAAIVIGAVHQLLTYTTDKFLIIDALLIAALVVARQLLSRLEQHRFTRRLEHIIQDLSQRESRLEATLERQRRFTDRLKQFDSMKDTFLHAVSHDLRTPLTAILGVALTLERARMNLPPEKATELLHLLVQKARKLDRLLSDLLDLNRLEQGILEPNRSATDLGTLIRRLVAEVDQLEGWPVTVEVDSMMANVDGPKIERIVENLLVNATRHTPRGTQVWVRVERRLYDLELIVEDAGAGVPEELRGTIFQPFEQGRSDGRAQGVGIGLSLVSRFAQLHGGRAWVTERKGGGASFHVLLPNAALDEDPTAFKPVLPGSGTTRSHDRWKDWNTWRARRARAAVGDREPG